MPPMIQRFVRSRLARPIRRCLRPVVSRLNKPIPAEVGSGHRCYVNPTSAVGRGLLAKGTFDEPLAQFIRQNLQAGQTFVDIGANVGFFSLVALSQVGAAGRVHAFEPDPRSLDCLHKTQKYNRFANLVIHGVAVGEELGLMGLMQAEEMGHSCLSEGAQGLTVPVISLDCLLPLFDMGGLNLIKIDVEGAELRVLHGSRAVLQRFRPTVVCEAVPKHLARFAADDGALVSYMRELGYTEEPLSGTADLNYVFRNA